MDADIELDCEPDEFDFWVEEIHEAIDDLDVDNEIAMGVALHVLLDRVTTAVGGDMSRAVEMMRGMFREFETKVAAGEIVTNPASTENLVLH